MIFSLDWLRSYVDLPDDPAVVTGLLTGLGIQADGIEAWGADHRLDLDVTTNRPDCMCHLGVARELAARLQETLRRPLAAPPRGPVVATEAAAVEVRDPDLCSRYSGLVITGVTVGPSPDWLEDRLASIGQRSINNIVDVTNFVLHELGQPLHAFDLDRLEGQRIIVRRAEPGEVMQTLDGIDRSLETSHLVIADSARAVALAGIMGGADSEIGAGTTRILLESAHFAPVPTRRASRALGLHTDASHRFERGTDPDGTLTAALRAAELIIETAGGELATGEIDVVAVPYQRQPIDLALAKTSRLLGVEVSAEQAMALLARLDFDSRRVAPDATLAVTPPSWRVDVTRDVDLVEEVGRLLDYDTIPCTLPAFGTDRTGAPRPATPQDGARRYLAAAGFHEAINFPMSSPEAQRPFLPQSIGEQDLVRLSNPLTQQMCILRGSLLPSLLENTLHNQNRGQEEIKLFEVGRVFDETPVAATADEPRLPRERPLVAALAAGHWRRGHWSAAAGPVGFFELKGVLEGVGQQVFGAPLTTSTAASRSFLDPDLAAEILLAGEVVGVMGRLHASLAREYGMVEAPFLFEIDLSHAPQTPDAARYRSLLRQPSADRDLALLLDETVTYSQVEEVIRDAAGELLRSLVPFDRYAGGSIPAGKVSLAVRLSFCHPQRTLTTEEVQQVQDRVVEDLSRGLGAVLRDA